MQNLVSTPYHDWIEDHVKFKFCIHEGRYRIRSEKFLNYLITACKGFTISEDGKYSLHYLLVILLTNWGSQRLISRCQVKVNKQIQEVFDLECGYTPIYHLRRHIFLLLDVELDYDHGHYTIWSLRKRALACTESDSETELVGQIQKSHNQCSEHNCLKIVNCYGYFVFYFFEEEIQGFIAPSIRLQLDASNNKAPEELNCTLC